MSPKFICLAVLITTAACDSPADPDIQGVNTNAMFSSVGAVASVTGSGQFPFFPPPGPAGLRLWKLALNAVQHADGATSGEWQIVVGASILHGNLDCVVVLPGGNRARVSGIVEDAKFTSFVPGTGFAVEIVDGGPGGAGDADQTTSALVFRNVAPGVARAFCEDGTTPSALALIAMESGNFTIRD